ncbi:hypothetical protein C4D60_Mb07t11840 [Musa balbisiana]|uniref:Uncharacterized protein n=1 Tax=Musa balbisiana TaxID=52838 RepID=A0A4S8JEW3_MUSBA|nr:hypothetical protein C4D60_Mb07t11840 [Musa balbisiana]
MDETGLGTYRKQMQNKGIYINLEEGTPIEFQGGRSPKEINPKLKICKGSNTWYQSSVLGVSLSFHSHPSSLHNRPKQFPQLLKRSSPNSVQLRGRNPYRVPRRPTPKEINPKLRICKGSITYLSELLLTQ